MAEQPWQRLPLWRSLQGSDRGARIDDVLAGAITAILLVPQGMAYALLAGLPAQLGLYASIVPPVVYALFGSSRALSVGPVAVAALMVSTALTRHAGDDPALWLSGAVILAVESGLILLLLGALRLDALVNFISHPVLSGFTSGAAVLIIVSQLPTLAGIALPREGVLTTLLSLWAASGEWQTLTLQFGLGAIAALLLARGPLPWLLNRGGLPPRGVMLICRAAPLAIVIATAWLASRPGTAGQIGVVGLIPGGLPSPSLAFLWSPGWRELLPSAALIALIGYVESVSVARVLAARRQQRIDANQELYALGLANVAAGLVGTLPVAGGFSRSVVNYDAGARTQLAAIVTAVLVGLVALWFTHWFAHLPQAVLAAIIIVAVARLVDLRAARTVLAYDRGDAAALATTFAGVLLYGIELGLAFGIIVSLAMYLWRTSRPHMAVLGRIPGTEHFRNIDRHQVECRPDVLIIRVDENLYFANVAAVAEYIESHVAEAPDTRHVLLVMNAVSYIDTSALEALEALLETLGNEGLSLHLAEVKGPVMDRLQATPMGRELARRSWLSIHLALQGIGGHDAADCPPPAREV